MNYQNQSPSFCQAYEKNNCSSHRLDSHGALPLCRRQSRILLGCLRSCRVVQTTVERLRGVTLDAGEAWTHHLPVRCHSERRPTKVPRRSSQCRRPPGLGTAERSVTCERNQNDAGRQDQHGQKAGALRHSAGTAVGGGAPRHVPCRSRGVRQTRQEVPHSNQHLLHRQADHHQRVQRRGSQRPQKRGKSTTTKRRSPVSSATSIISSPRKRRASRASNSTNYTMSRKRTRRRATSASCPMRPQPGDKC